MISKFLKTILFTGITICGALKASLSTSNSFQHEQSGKFARLHHDMNCLFTKNITNFQSKLLLENPPKLPEDTSNLDIYHTFHYNCGIRYYPAQDTFSFSLGDHFSIILPQHTIIENLYHIIANNEFGYTHCNVYYKKKKHSLIVMFYNYGKLYSPDTPQKIKDRVKDMAKFLLSEIAISPKLH